MKDRGLAIILLVISLFLAEIQTIQSVSLRSQVNVINPSIVEYVSSFRVGTKDLADAIANQYKDIIIPVVKTSYAELHQTAMTVQYVGTGRTIKNISPVKATVSNDTFRLNFNFTATVSHIVGSQTYHCSTSIPLISVNYTKEVDFGTGNIIVDSLTTNYSYTLFSTPTCLEKMKQEKDKTRIIEAVIATEGSSMFTELKKHIDKMQGYFNLNSKTQHLSKLYQTNPYVYDYYGYQIKVNVSTVQASQYGEEGVANGIMGGIINTTHTAVAPPAYQPTFTTFYSLQFIENMIESSINNYPKWKDIKMNRLNMRTSIFKYRLIDFEYIIPNLLPKYPKYYLSDIQISCSVFQMLDSVITEKNFIQRLKWKCSGSFEVSPDVSPDKKVTFLDFYPVIDHTLIINTRTEYASVLVTELELLQLAFSPVDDLYIVDQKLAANYFTEGLFEFRVYTIGSFFKVNAVNDMVKLVPGVGVWIG